MPPAHGVFPRASAPHDDKKEPLTLEYIIGIVVACVLFVTAGAWWIFKVIKRKRSQSELTRGSKVFSTEDLHEKGQRRTEPTRNAFNRANVTASIILPARRNPLSEKPGNGPSEEPFYRSYLPPTRPMMGPNHIRKQSSLGSSRPSSLRLSSLPNGGGSNASSPFMTPQDIIEHHKAEGTFPVNFAPVAIRDSVMILPGKINQSPSKNPKALHSASASTSSLAPGAHNKQSPSMGSRHSRFSSLTHSFRNSMASWNGSGLSPTKSVFTFGKKHTEPTLPEGFDASQQMMVRATFNPLLPDELVVSVGDSVTIVETYDDGWSIVARMHLGLLEVGALPGFVLGLPGHEAGVRPMRSSSLGVTVDLKVIDQMDGDPRIGAAHPRDSIISWSNF